MAVSGSAREGWNGMALRHRSGNGRSDCAPDRTQRARGDRDLSNLCRCAAALRSAGTRWQTCGPLREELSQRAGQGKWTVLARGARSEAESAGRSRGAGGRARAPARHERRATLHVSRLLLQNPDRAGTGRLRRSKELRRERRHVWRLCARRMARAVRRHRCDDVHRQSRRHPLSEGSGTRDRERCQVDDAVQPRSVVAAIKAPTAARICL